MTNHLYDSELQRQVIIPDLKSANFSYVGSASRIGDPEKSADVISKIRDQNAEFEPGKRYYFFDMGPDDMKLAQIAGWEEYLAGNGSQYLIVPKGTRSAQSILGGLEAWEGEKLNIVNFISGYTNVVKEQFGDHVDIGLSLASVARTKNEKVFNLPPHKLTNNSTDIQRWSQNLLDDTDDILANDDQRPKLVSRLEYALYTITKDRG